ncbi:hypothetical protein FB45DRAFT_916982 [Roridomyces roridus]|uniref:P-loop containing nucleoside triphosphate hydrolase protein n=1 Tax=Roridomyces roridus TaxID=1738132 RepID=A0AAD7FLB3_9AGAR|nr:hypothetical protein FB45DRAFT_916982 [Roridomyces roridus]
MSLGLTVRHGRRLLMPLEKYRRSAATAVKRSFPQTSSSPASKLPRLADSPSVSYSKPFSLPNNKPAPQMPSSSSSRSRPSRPSRNHSRPNRGPKLPLLDGPINDKKLILEQHSHTSTPLLTKHASAPRSSVNNWAIQVLGAIPAYVSVQGISETGHPVWRTTVNLETTPPIAGIGDDTDKSKSVTLAALSAALQLNNLGILNSPPKPKTNAAVSNTINLSDSTRSFMDYYCRRFGFPKPEITFALMDAASKKNAQITCYLDVMGYLESCDPDLWKAYLEAAKSGAALGMAPKIFFEMSDRLDDEIRDLCVDMKNSQLYKRRPAIAGDAPDAASKPTPTAPRVRRPDPAMLAEKSERLSRQHQEYLADPQLETMRKTRMSLPVYTRADDVLSQIEDNDVTICMAATGSGKTTQIPQLILDSYIEAGQGASCNIVCTQPRRLAALSVADRVAKERGETLGKSVGYQVRFEAKLPEEHGAITFCTTGVFLKRLQSALSGERSFEGRSLDDVTHVVVDEVHERDVDTDLLLVVLKQLMDDRKQRKIPLKIVLMSATIDPTLFQHYFPDDSGQPAKVVEVPGRSFPVAKHFLDEFLPSITKGPASWIMRDPAVVKYVERETSSVLTGQEEDVDLPPALIAATVAHVLQLTDSGHVLVFLPGWDDIINVQKMLMKPLGPLGTNFSDTNQYSLHLLHSSIPLAEQQVIFEPPKAGVRRIILATNIAETSVTIPDVVYVVDTAKIKEAALSARQGSASYQTVEMKRVDLSNVVMHVKALNFPGLSVEDVLAACIEPPLPERVSAAMVDLQMVGALDAKNNLTALGRVLLQIPVEVQLGRLVLYGCFFRCLDQALTLAAILSNRDCLEASRAKQSWTNEHFRSDALAGLAAFNVWWPMQARGEYVAANRFCSDNFLSKPTLLMIQKIKVHLLQALFRAGVIDVSAGGRVNGPGSQSAAARTVPAALNVNGDSQPLLAALIAIASQPKFAIRTGEKVMTFIHPSSVNNRKHIVVDNHDEKQLYAFMEKRQNTTSSSSPQTTLVTTTRLDPLTYMLFGAYKLQVTERGLDCDGWLPIVGNLDALDDIQRLKTLMESSMLRVFEGIIMNRRQSRAANLPILPREEEPESEAEDEDFKDLSMSREEVKELDYLTRDIVRILNRYSEERQNSMSRQNSRPATPYGRSAFSTPGPFATHDTQWPS